MSLTPIFDETLADAPVNIWQASSIFPRPISNPWDGFVEKINAFDFPPFPETFQESLSRIGHPAVHPANLSFLRSIA